MAAVIERKQWYEYDIQICRPEQAAIDGKRFRYAVAVLRHRYAGSPRRKTHFAHAAAAKGRKHRGRPSFLGGCQCGADIDLTVNGPVACDAS